MDYKEYINTHKAMVDVANNESVCMVSIPNAEKACKIAVRDFARQLLTMSPTKAMELAEKVANKEIG